MRIDASVLPPDLLESARILLAANRGRPTAASLRRATSSTYYALVHCLARDCADLLIGASKIARSEDAWRQVYRSLDHGQVKDRCRDKAALAKLPRSIEGFATAFMALQQKRHRADYDPFASFSKTEVEADLRLAENAIADFATAETKDRRAFCVFVLLKKRV